MARLGRKTTKNVPQNWRRRSYFLFFGASLSSCAAEWIGIAKSSLVAFERILSSFAAKPIRNATLCLVAFEHIPSSSAAKPIRIANLTLLPRDVCGYARANVAPLTRNQRCHTQKLVLLPCWSFLVSSCFAECGSKSTLMSGGCRGLRPGSCTLPLAVHMSLHCLWQSKFNRACLLQNSTGIPAPFETFLWLALRRGPIFEAVLHCVPCMYFVGFVGVCKIELCCITTTGTSWTNAQLPGPWFNHLTYRPYRHSAIIFFLHIVQSTSLAVRP